MKKLFSLIKACMSSDMNIFKIKKSKKSKASNILIPLFIALYLMFLMWGMANSLFEKLIPLHLEYIVLPLFVFTTSLMTIIEGIYKSSSLIFNCKDDDLLLSLPIKKKTILFIRMFKFYIFELLFNSIFMLPVMIAYIRWGEVINWTYYLSSFIVIILLPVIPIVISCIIGAISSSISSKFKYKNAIQIILSMAILIGVMAISFNSDNFLNYLIQHATSLNDLITKIYYPAGVYAKLVTDFNVIDLFIFIIINIFLIIITIYIFSKFYFKLNSRLKKVITNKKVKIDNLTIKSKSQIVSLVEKEITTFFKTPVFIINAGFGLVLFILVVIIISIKFDSVIPMLTDPNGLNLSNELINNGKSILLFLLISTTAYMTSITNSVISLEGKKINILKSLPIDPKKILMSKIYSGLIITTPVLLIGTIVLIMKFKINIIESILLIMLLILIPLVSHFIGILVNLKYPKLDAENATEVVKQSMSSFIAVMIGMVLLFITFIIIFKLIKLFNSVIILLIFTLVYIFINVLLYLYLINKGVKEYNELSI